MYFDWIAKQLSFFTQDGSELQMIPFHLSYYKNDRLDYKIHL